VFWKNNAKCVLAKVGYSGTWGDSDGVTGEGSAKVVEKVLVEVCIAIPAHVDGAKGLLQLESEHASVGLMRSW
jgi:hypothetical protein